MIFHVVCVMYFQYHMTGMMIAVCSDTTKWNTVWGAREMRRRSLGRAVDALRGVRKYVPPAIQRLASGDYNN